MNIITSSVRGSLISCSRMLMNIYLYISVKGNFCKKIFVCKKTMIIKN